MVRIERIGTRGSPTHQVLELPPGLFDDAVLTAEDDAHLREVADLCPAHNKGVDVEPASGEDARDAREDSWLVVHETVEHMPISTPTSALNLQVHSDMKYARTS